MKIILMGQQAFGKSALEKFHTESDHEVVAVYCAPDKEGKPLDPVKEYAQSVGLPVFQPSNFKDQEVLDQIKSHDADLCVMAYVIIFVPEAARDIPKYGSVCFHPSLLPAFPGVKSIDKALNYSVQILGNTAHFIDEGIDTGPIIMQSVISRAYFKCYEDVLSLQLKMLKKIWSLLEKDKIRVTKNKVTIDEVTNKNTFFSI